MRRSIEIGIFVLILGATAAVAGDRLAVFEFFGRTTCGNCGAAAETVVELQHELAGQAVLLEYDYDEFLEGRQDRFWATGVSADYLPLMMVGSGFRTSHGVVDFDTVYRGMIDAELARPPRAEISAFWQRVGSNLRVYVEVENIEQEYLEVDREASVWVIAYESPPSGPSHTENYVESTAQWSLPYDLGPRESITATISTPSMTDVQWNRMHAVVLVEDRPGCGCEEYDMLQATEALQASLTAAPDLVVLGRAASSEEIELTGPHVLSWTATPDVPWLEVTPSSGTRPTTATVTVRDELRPQSETEGTVSFAATGDGMDFSTTVSVQVGSKFRRAGRRMSPVQTKGSSRSQFPR